MKSANFDEFQEKLAILLNKSIKNSKIKKKQIAELIGVSAAYMTQISTKNKKLPSPKTLRNIVKIIEDKCNNSNFEEEVEEAIAKYENVNYRIQYHAYKAIESCKDVELLFKNL
ncbi:MAG: hypothetical protein GY797_39050 [Deltaproteobacteria bacterium]|nr:hypothetical protein [Deltaproteobacteria bacterium]